MQQKQSETKRKIDQKLKRKMMFDFRWSVHPLRKDKRTGPITVHKRDKYTSYLMEEEIKRIRESR